MSITPTDQAIALIRRSEKILCLSQAHARADGIAAVLAFQTFGQKLGKEIVAVLPHGVSQNLQFLPGHENITENLGEPGNFVISLSTEKSQVERVKYTIEENSVDILVTPKNGSFSPQDVTFRHNTAHFDLILIFDCPSLESLGPVFNEHTELFASTPTLSISANPATADYAKINLVDATKSSSCEILFDCFQHDAEYKTKIDAHIATSLLTGMIASTGSFLRSNTTASSLEAAALLQSIGAEQSDIIEHLFKQKSFKTLKVWGKVFSSLELDPIHKIAWTYLTQNDLSQLDANETHIKNITTEILRYTEDIDIAVLVVEHPNTTIAQLRTKNQNLNWIPFIKNLNVTDQENGIDINFSESSATKVTEELVSKLSLWQQNRLQLPVNTPITKLKALAQKSSVPTFPVETILKDKFVHATPPAEVPFSVPGTQAHLKERKGEEALIPPETQAAEVTVNMSEKGIPDWLKKSFPKN